MNPKDIKSLKRPIFTTRAEVMISANQNRCFYEGFSDNPLAESLKHSWGFYSSVN